MQRRGIHEAKAGQVDDQRARLLGHLFVEQAAQIGEGELTQVEASTADGSLFVVKDGTTMIAASTSAEPTAGLVFYDLKTCLRSVGDAEPEPVPASAEKAAKPRRRAAAKPKEEGDDATS